MNAPNMITPLMRPFLPATADFGSGKDSARQFLERCIIELGEPKIGAFVSRGTQPRRFIYSKKAVIVFVFLRARHSDVAAPDGP